jgi:hypothetical protein
MLVSLTNSTFHHSGIQGEVLENFKEVFPYYFIDLFEGFIYLGYFLKTKKYKAEDWRWLRLKIGDGYLQNLKKELVIGVIGGFL